MPTVMAAPARTPYGLSVPAVGGPRDGKTLACSPATSFLADAGRYHVYRCRWIRGRWVMRYQGLRVHPAL